MSARVKIDPLFGKPQAFTDEVLDTGTCVIELDGINEGVADKRTLRAIIMDNPQATGKILVLEADPLIFYGAPITDANSLQNGQLLQFTRYSDNTDGGSAVIDGYLSARKAYFPADTSLLPTRAAGILELPQTRFNRYLPFPARDMQPLELDGETFYAWKKPNIMGHYELYRINPTQPTQLTSANQFAVLEEGEWQRLGLKGGGPKKTLASLAAERKELNAKHQLFLSKEPEMTESMTDIWKLHKQDPATYRADFEKAIDERIRFYQEEVETLEKLFTMADTSRFNDMASLIVEEIIINIRRRKVLYWGDLDNLTKASSGKYEQALADYISGLTQFDLAECRNALKRVLDVSDKVLAQQIAEESYLAKLKTFSRQGEEVFNRVMKDSSGSSLATKTRQIPLLASMIPLQHEISADSTVGYVNLSNDLHEMSASVKHTVCTYLELIDNPSLFSLAERESLLHSIIQQYEKSEMNYQTLQQIFVSWVSKEYVDRLLERISDSKKSAEEMLATLAHQSAPEQPLTPRSSQDAATVKRIFRTKKGLLIGKERPRSHTSQPRIMEVIDPNSQEISGEFQEILPNQWAPTASRFRKIPLPAQTLKSLMKDANDMLASTKRFIKNAEYQSRTQAMIPSEVEEILCHQAKRMQQRATELRQALSGGSENDAATKMATDLESKATDLIDKGRTLRLRMSKQQDPRINRLKYLLEQEEVSIEKMGERKKLGAKNSQDWLQEYEIKDKTTRQPLWYAHFHYKQANDPFENFSAAHLKTREQRRTGLSMQITQEQQGEEVIRILRSKIDPDSATIIFKNIVGK
ncbi:hypothetical protein [Candidatus Regiella insecticola]|uniref:hypothetical protein n=1 Tax=Candidatus Regiella insecticola TaxID=138073 RepID=UPI00030F2E16|nr:hypothetical protein [Candidatus Regiella insecticola]